MSLPAMPYNALARRLACCFPLDEDDLRAIDRLCAVPRRRVAARREFLREGDRPGQVHILLEGWASRLVMLPDGRRQITAFHLPGDILWRPMGDVRMDFSILALTPAMVVPIASGAFEPFVTAHPGIAMALATQDRVAEAVQRRWLVNLGQRTAFERIGHLFCELHHRLDAIGLAHENSFAFPVTQVELAEATGLTPVHVNRVLRDMRLQGLIDLEHRALRILQFSALAQRTLFDPDYLEPHGPLRLA
ncbi:Crp/Fnr family transcriptional regulator [Novosphingobium sp. SG720]|uniref:Crp/Fnr family transcriptional regulator n=1 Tax=Novosphingobium sp. SG720 TaxID=2586998 RepID=UPI0014453655|nr:Crp/Fnr family transcriptional regulator [Novosphingobium sp. SG720]